MPGIAPCPGTTVLGLPCKADAIHPGVDGKWWCLWHRPKPVAIEAGGDAK